MSTRRRPTLVAGLELSALELELAARQAQTRVRVGVGALARLDLRHVRTSGVYDLKDMFLDIALYIS